MFHLFVLLNPKNFFLSQEFIVIGAERTSLLPINVYFKIYPQRARGKHAIGTPRPEV